MRSTAAFLFLKFSHIKDESKATATLAIWDSHRQLIDLAVSNVMLHPVSGASLRVRVSSL